MRWRLTILAEGLALACLGSLWLYSLHLSKNEKEMQGPPNGERVADGVPTIGARWEQRRAQAKAATQRELKELCGKTPDRQMELVLANLPGEVADTVESLAQRNDISAETRAEFQKAVPVLKGRARAQQRRRAMREHFAQQALAAYQEFGHHSPAWDDLVKDLMTIYFLCPRSGWTMSEEIKDLETLARALEDKARCDDPLVGYICASVAGEYALSSSGRSSIEMYKKAVALEQSRYPTKWRQALAGGLFTMGEMGLNYEQGDQRKMSVELVNHFDDFLSSDIYTAGEKGMIARALTRYRIKLAKFPISGIQAEGRQAEFDRMYAQAERALKGTTEPALLKGCFYTEYAEFARWYAPEADGPESLGKLMVGRSATAAKALKSAYEMDPADPQAATMMLQTMLEIGDRPEMEKWFQRAMGADPDNLEACRNKLSYLEPKWRGSPEQMLEFARECKKVGNYRGQTAFLPALAHEKLLAYVKNPGAYLRQSGAWDEIASVFEEGLPLAPQCWPQHAEYAGLATLAGKWDEANREFDIAAGRASLRAVIGDSQLSDLQEIAAEHRGRGDKGTAKGSAVQ
jgi:tetratricopeptide (TPR) repeat protein